MRERIAQIIGLFGGSSAYPKSSFCCVVIFTFCLSPFINNVTNVNAIQVPSSEVSSIKTFIVPSVVLVIDYDIYKEMNEDFDDVHQYCKDIVEIMNSLYRPMNVSIDLAGVVVLTKRNEIQLSNERDTMSRNFLAYRKEVLLKDYPNNILAQLLTTQVFNVGMGPNEDLESNGKPVDGPIRYEMYGGMVTKISSDINRIAATLAHVLGHNLGMSHDDSEECKCPDERCMMSENIRSTKTPTRWSQCSLNEFTAAAQQGLHNHLTHVPIKMIDDVE